MQFRIVSNDFKIRLKNDIRSIQTSVKVFTFAVKQKVFTKWKTENSHQMTLQKHSNNQTKTFITTSIWKNHIEIKLEITDKIESMSRKPTYVK